jgi:hypothetical protein
LQPWIGLRQQQRCCIVVASSVRTFLLHLRPMLHTEIALSRCNTTLTSLDLSYNEIGDNGAVAIARLLEEHEEMPVRVELWTEAKHRRISLAEELERYSQQVLEFKFGFVSIVGFSSACLLISFFLSFIAGWHPAAVQGCIEDIGKDSTGVAQGHVGTISRLRKWENGWAYTCRRIGCESERIASG